MRISGHRLGSLAALGVRERINKGSERYLQAGGVRPLGQLTSSGHTPFALPANRLAGTDAAWEKEAWDVGRGFS